MSNLLGERMKVLRRERGWTQEDLADKSKVSLRTIQRLERGERPARPGTLDFLAAALDVEPNELEVGFTSETLRALETEFVCPHCGALLAQRTGVEHEYGSDEVEVFECGFTRGWTERPCPTDSRFPRFEDYELTFRQERDGRWFCYPQPTTRYARQVMLPPGSGHSREEAEMWVQRAYIRERSGYDAAEEYVNQRLRDLGLK